MILNRTFSVDVTSTEASKFVLMGPNTIGAAVMLENKDALNYVTYRFQGAAVNQDSGYTDLANTGGNAGVSGVIPPLGQVMVTLKNTDSYTRMLGVSSGGVELQVGLTQFSTNDSTNFTNGQL